MYGAAAPTALSVAEGGQYAAVLITDAALAAQREIPVHPVVDQSLALPRQCLARQLTIGLSHVAVLDADATGVTEGTVDDKTATDIAVGRLREYICHSPVVAFADVPGRYFIFLAATYFCHDHCRQENNNHIHRYIKKGRHLKKKANNFNGLNDGL